MVSWASGQSLFLPGVCDLYALVDSILLLVMGDRFITLHLNDLPDDLSLLDWNDVPVQIRDFVIDPSQDLWIVVEQEALYVLCLLPIKPTLTHSSSHPPSPILKLHILSLSEHHPHPDAAQTIVEFGSQDSPHVLNLRNVSIRILGDLVGVYTRTQQANQIVIFNWRTGATILVRYLFACGGAINTQS